LHYFAKRFFNSLYINAYETSDFFELWFCNDLPVKFKGSYEIKMMDLSGEILYQNKGELIASGLFSTVVERVNFDDLNKYHNHAVIFFKAFDPMGNIVSDGFKLLAAPKDLKLSKPVINFEMKKDADQYTLIITAKQPILYCSVETNEDVIFSDNYFSFSGGKKVVHFRYDGEIDKNSITIRSLYDYLE